MVTGQSACSLVAPASQVNNNYDSAFCSHTSSQSVTNQHCIMETTNSKHNSSIMTAKNAKAYKPQSKTLQYPFAPSSDC